jgi:hypothetical protein
MVAMANEMPYLAEETLKRNARGKGYSGGKYTWGDFKNDMRGVLNYISPVSKPIIGALTNKAVGAIEGAGMYPRRAIRGAIRGMY